MKKSIAYLFVTIQFSILGLMVFGPDYLIDDDFRFERIGRIITYLGILMIFWAAISIRTSLTIMPIPKKNAKMGLSGLYKYIRHPMYSALILFGVGEFIKTGAFSELILTLILSIVLYHKSKYEEILLRRKFANYEDYTSNTGRFLPKLFL